MQQFARSEPPFFGKGKFPRKEIWHKKKRIWLKKVFVYYGQKRKFGSKMVKNVTKKFHFLSTFLVSQLYIEVKKRMRPLQKRTQ